MYHRNGSVAEIAWESQHTTRTARERDRMRTRPHEKISRFQKWAIGVAFCVIHTSLILLDLYMVIVLKVQSISGRVWDACDEHPTLVAAGMLGTVGIAYLVRHWWWMVMFAGIMGGHLFVHT